MGLGGSTLITLMTDNIINLSQVNEKEQYNLGSVYDSHFDDMENFDSPFAEQSDTKYYDRVQFLNEIDAQTTYTSYFHLNF